MRGKAISFLCVSFEIGNVCSRPFFVISFGNVTLSSAIQSHLRCLNLANALAGTYQKPHEPL